MAQSAFQSSLTRQPGLADISQGMQPQVAPGLQLSGGRGLGQSTVAPTGAMPSGNGGMGTFTQRLSAMQANKPQRSSSITGANSQWSQDMAADNASRNARMDQAQSDLQGRTSSAMVMGEEEEASPRKFGGPQLPGVEMRREAEAAKIEAQLSLQEAKLRQAHFNQLQEINKSLLEIGPSKELFTKIEKRLTQLVEDPDSVLMSTAYKQHQQELAQATARTLNAQGYDPSGGMGLSVLQDTLAKSRMSYTNDLRNFFVNVLGLATPIRQSAASNYNATGLAMAEQFPAGQALGSLANYSRASSMAGMGAIPADLASLMLQMQNGLRGVNKALRL